MSDEKSWKIKPEDRARLKSAIKAAGLTQEQVAERIRVPGKKPGISVQMLSYILNGHRNMTAPVFRSLCSVLGIDPEEVERREERGAELLDDMPRGVQPEEVRPMLWLLEAAGYHCEGRTFAGESYPEGREPLWLRNVDPGRCFYDFRDASGGELHIPEEELQTMETRAEAFARVYIATR